jgi:hypothetical protein
VGTGLGEFSSILAMTGVYRRPGRATVGLIKP